MVPLIKIDKNAPDLELPKQIVQLIPRQWHAMYPVEIDNEFEKTNRGERRIRLDYLFNNNVKYCVDKL